MKLNVLLPTESIQDTFPDATLGAVTGALRSGHTRKCHPPLHSNRPQTCPLRHTPTQSESANSSAMCDPSRITQPGVEKVSERPSAEIPNVQLLISHEFLERRKF